jgi:DNA repair protein RadD
MPPQQLRDYQQRGVTRIFEAIRRGAKRILIVSPTGSGKTTVFCHLCSQLAARGKPSLINVHRRELASQACNRLREFGTDFGLIMGTEQTRPWARVQVASVQTLVNRRPPPAVLVVNDEAHLSTANTWTKILEQYPNAIILGFTATPFRLGGEPLKEIYDEIVIIATPAELREHGHLCDYVGFSYHAPDLSKVKSTGGDYNERQSAAAMCQSLIVDNIVDEWLAHASHLSTVVFAVTVEHSLTLTERFKKAGVVAEHLDGKTPKHERDAILKRVEAGTTRVLCNVGVAVEGLDIPRLKCCVLARPTKSLARAIQMAGRVRRPWQGVTARIHDHAFVFGPRGFGLPDDDRDYSLRSKDAPPDPVTVCDRCLAQYRGDKCPACSHANKKRIQGERVMNTIDEQHTERFEFGSDDAGAVQAEQPPKPPVDVTWNDPGRRIEGVFQRKWQEETTYGKPRARYLVKGKRREYSFPGTMDLDARMARVNPGDLIRVTYLKEQPLPQGRIKKLFKVEIDDGT